MRRRIVLVGGGHSHALLLARWARQAPAAHRTLVCDAPHAVYSGMVPGFVAGDYTAQELTIDLAPLARRAGVALVARPAVALDHAGGRVLLPQGATVPYDLLSLDVGSTVAGLDVPGVREHALATRPIDAFLAGVDPLLARARERALAEPPTPLRIAIVGAGAAGVELALTLHARLARASAVAPALALVDAEDTLLGGRSPRLARRALQLCAERGITLRLGARVAQLDAQGLRFAEGSVLAADAVIWAAGAAPLSWLRASGLALDAAGFVRVRPTLQALGHDAIFVTGDAASLDGHADLPKAGVYAVRAAPVLAHNLEAALRGAALRAFRPQGDFLTLLNVGERRALGAKWGIPFAGGWVWRLKDAIDRRFVAGLRSADPVD